MFHLHPLPMDIQKLKLERVEFPSVSFGKNTNDKFYIKKVYVRLDMKL